MFDSKPRSDNYCFENPEVQIWKGIMTAEEYKRGRLLFSLLLKKRPKCFFFFLGPTNGASFSRAQPMFEKGAQENPTTKLGDGELGWEPVLLISFGLIQLIRVRLSEEDF